MANPFDEFDNVSDSSNPFDEFDKGNSVSDYLKGIGEAGLTLATGAAAMPLGFLAAGMQKLNNPNEVNFEEQTAANMGRMTYEPRTAKGQHYAENVGKVINELIPMMPLHGAFPAIRAGEAVNAIKARTGLNEVPKGRPDLAAANAQLAKTAEVPKGRELENLKSTEELGGQMNLFDQFDEVQGRPNQFQAEPQNAMWRTDENGIPIRADLSMEAANLENPLQRNLFGDELGPALDQGRSLTEAIDTMEKTPIRNQGRFTGLDERTEALKRLQGEIEASPALEVAKMELEGPRIPSSQRGAINPEVFREGFQKVKELANGITLLARSHGDSLTVTAMKDGKKLGGAVYEKTNRFDTPEKANLAATATGINKEAQGGGLASQVYKFASELGNDIVPSKVQTAAGKGMWNSFENKGLSKGGYIPKSQRGGVRLDYTQRKEHGVLKNIPGIKERLGDLLPDQRPLEQFLKEEASTPDVNQNAFQKGINNLTKGGVYQAIKTQNPLIKRVSETILNADNAAKADINSLIHDNLAQKSRSLSKQEKADVWAIQQASENSKVPLTREFLEKHGFNEKQIAWVEAHREVMDTVFGKMNEAMEASGAKPVSPQVAYLSSRASGDFRKLVYDKDGSVVGILGANTRKGLLSDAQKLSKLHPEYKIGEERYFGGGRGKGGTAEGFSQMLEFLSENDPKMKEFVKQANDMLTKDALDYMNAKSHTKAKKGIFGMEGRKPFEDAVTNAEQGMEAQIKYAEKIINWAEMSKAVKELKPLMKEDNGLNMPNAKQWSESYIQQALGNNPTALGRSLDKVFAEIGKSSGLGVSIPTKVVANTKRLINGVLLGFGNIGFLAMNMIQPFRSSPAMFSMLKGRGLEKSFDANTGYRYLADAMGIMYKEIAGKELKPYEAEALKYAKENHVYSSDLFDANNNTNKNVGYYWDKGTRFGASRIESTTRQMAYLSYVKLLHENGLTKADGIYQAAQRLTDIQMNNYSQIEAPKVYASMGGIGRSAYNLMSFKHNEYSRLAMLANELGRSNTTKPLLTELASNVAFAGVMGTILFSEADFLVKKISKMLKKPTSLTKLLLDNPDISDSMKYGMGSLAGVDLTNRLGVGPLTPGQGHAMDALMPGSSKLINIAKAAGSTIAHPNEFNAKNLIREAAPNSIVGPIDRAWFSPENAKGQELSMNRNKIQANAVRNEKDKFFKSLGMTGLNEAKQKSRDYENSSIDKVYGDMRKSIIENASKELFTSGKLPSDFAKKYIAAQGDLASLDKEVLNMAMEQNVDAYTLGLIKNSMSNSLTTMHKTKRMLGKE